MTDCTRRTWMGAALGGIAARAAERAPTHQATGHKVGEVSPASALIWTRRTLHPARNSDGEVRKTKPAQHLEPGKSVASLEGACPGGEGAIRVEWEGAGRRSASEWVAAGPETDFTHQFPLTGLEPDTLYRYSIQTRGREVEGAVRGSFRTAPEENASAEMFGVLLSCQKYCEMDLAPGFKIYDAIRRLRPHFLLSCGDNVYYDSDDPIANTVDIARYHWHRMYSVPSIRECLRVVPGYWQKDDHDLLSDDCWPGLAPAKMQPLTFEQGLKLFREQTPFPEQPYRIVRWGKHVHIWLLEGRDFRSPNTQADGPQKSIWGERQKQWLKETLQTSRAEWRLIISPNPIVGPDRLNKRDNHANAAFHTEGAEFREWLAKNCPNNTFVFCGDRHWQYHSVDPASGVQEFGCGAATDSHASGTPGEQKQYHRFHRVRGGFVTVRASRQRLIVQHRNVDGRVVYECRRQRTEA